MKTQVHPIEVPDRMQQWRAADQQALRAERQLVHKMTAAARGRAPEPSQEEQRHAQRLRALANELLGRAIG